MPFNKVVIPSPAGSERTNTPVPSSESTIAMMGTGVVVEVCDGLAVMVGVLVAVGDGEGVRLAVDVSVGGKVGVGVRVGRPSLPPKTAPAPVKPMKIRMPASKIAAPSE